MTLEELPPVLVLHLKRFVFEKTGGCQKLSKNIDYPVDLEISKGTDSCWTEYPRGFIFEPINALFHLNYNNGTTGYTWKAQFRRKSFILALESNSFSCINRFLHFSQGMIDATKWPNSTPTVCMIQGPMFPLSVFDIGGRSSASWEIC